MALEDEKTTFSTDKDIFCYKVMLFSLRNVQPISPRKQSLQRSIRQNMEVYMDDMVVKSKFAKTHIDDLKVAFITLQKYQMKLNLTKCAFKVISRKFLNFMISGWGIEANLKKNKAM